MDFFLSKLTPVFIYPLGFALVLMIFAAVIVRRSATWARLFLLVAAAVLWTASTPRVAGHLGLMLEKQYPPIAVEASQTADAIVVLGGAVSGPQPPRIVPDLSAAGDRVLHAARLYRAGKAPRVLVSGGSIAWLGSAEPEAGFVKELLQEWGVPAKVIITESASRNTRENAVFSQELLVEQDLQRVLLVTSALHMPRALATFKAAGVDAIPAATDYTVTYATGRTVFDFLPDAEALLRTTYAIKEHVGLAYYRSKGWIKN